MKNQQQDAKLATDHSNYSPRASVAYSFLFTLDWLRGMLRMIFSRDVRPAKHATQRKSIKISKNLDSKIHTPQVTD
jgi:hypothetical protein